MHTAVVLITFHDLQNVENITDLHGGKHDALVVLDVGRVALEHVHRIESVRREQVSEARDEAALPHALRHVVSVERRRWARQRTALRLRQPVRQPANTARKSRVTRNCMQFILLI